MIVDREFVIVSAIVVVSGMIVVCVLVVPVVAPSMDLMVLLT